MASLRNLSSLFSRISSITPRCITPSFSFSSFNGLISSDNIVRCPFPDVNIPETNLSSHVFNMMDRFSSSNIALMDGITNQQVTYAQFKETTCNVSSSLRRLGLVKGDVVTLFMPNSINYSVIFLATMAAGGIVSTSNPTYTANELCYQIKNSNAKFVMTTPTLLPTVLEATKGMALNKIIITDDDSTNNTQIKDNMISFSSLQKDSGSLFKEEVVNSKADIAVLPYSSGTTGLPKGVMLTHYNVTSNLCQISHPELIDLKEGEPNLGLLPFFHIYGMVVIMLHSLTCGAKNIVLPKFEPETFLSCIERNQITTANLVPPIVLFLAKHPLVSNYNLSCIRSVFSGAAPLGGDVVAEAHGRTGVSGLRQGYGLTETSPVTHGMPKSLGMSKPASIGVPVQNQSVKIAHLETGEALGPGEEGEVCIAGPNVMLGYLNLPDATKGCIKDGWFHTGDIGYYDTDGHFFITDRLKELIKVKGLQVAPAELEALLQTHPQISDAAVIGIPHERLGEAPRAFVVRRDESLTEEEVERYVKEALSEHKWLVGGVQFIEQVPKSASGKILRRNLKE